MLKEIVKQMKNDLMDFNGHEQKNWIQSFIIEHKGDYYMNSIQEKNRLDDSEVQIIQIILGEIGYVRWENKIRFNISKFYKTYKKIIKENEN